VLSSRFTPRQGYTVESRRGGGGYVRITRIPFDRNAFLMHFVNSMGEELDSLSARAILQNLSDYGVIDAREMKILAKLTGDNALKELVPAGKISGARASILRNAIIALI